MIPKTNLPRPQFDYRTRDIVNVYKQAVVDIKQELNSLDITDLRRAHAQGALVNISKRLKTVDAETAKWVNQNIPEVAEEGVAMTLLADGVVETLDKGREIARFNRANREMVDAVIADTQDDLLQITQNMSRRTKTAVRKAVSESMRANVAKGVTGTRTISQENLKRIRRILDESVEKGIIDAGGKRWKPETYAEMLTKTKMREAHQQGTTNEALERGVMYGIISSHGATDPCSYHEGRIIRLSPDAPGDYPTYEELHATDQIFHPNCLHVVSPIRKPELLPEEVKQKAQEQDTRGRKAVATGKRTPSDADVGEVNIRERNLFPKEKGFKGKVEHEISLGAETEQDMVRIGGAIDEEIETRVAREDNRLTAEFTANDNRLKDEKVKIINDLNRLDESGRPLIGEADAEALYARAKQIDIERVSLHNNYDTATANLRRNTVKETFSEFREMGVQNLPAQSFVPYSKKKAKDAINEVRDLLPTDWVRTSNQTPIKAITTNRGYYWHRTRAPHELSVGKHNVNKTAIHEMGHRMEAMRPDIKKLEHDFYKRRTAGNELKWLGEPYGDNEMFREGNWNNNYMGKSYGETKDSHYEILSMGIESVYFNTRRTNLRGDADYRRFIYGIIATK